GYKAKDNEGKRDGMFPKDESLRQLWTKAPESTDSNPSRSDRSGKTLCLKILKKDAVPSNFPNLPHYYSKKPPPKRSSTSTSSSRLLNENERIKKRLRLLKRPTHFYTRRASN
ncbi:Putative LOC100212901, partial [Caligus rogercresseyi]